ncbi:hypothetical protein CVD28_03775 [Bacillus sp. M6-12]|uniref:hypothetical protein n=1 Tax=Bacillus sp. M6-12 TaxID=2054166 RepID=UPI000C75B715|nr:hypothetical protein [Bacillus sp. M6-12]PLS19546.1 hypothetical protein CVD28_03775 [Bacillus sp. M6-12]
MNDMKVAENIANLGMMAGSLFTEGMIEFDDSKELMQTIIELGSVFEEKFGKIVEEEEDYIGYIDAFAQKELLKRYSVKELVLMGIHHTQKDESMTGANFFLGNESGIESIVDGNVAVLYLELKEACSLLLKKEGYEIVDSFIYYEDQVLSFEIKKMA